MSDIDRAVQAVFDVKGKDGEITLIKNKVKLTGWGNLRAFLMELHDFLFKNDFVDNRNPGYMTARPGKEGGGSVMLKKGEFADPGAWNRNPDMYELEFRDVELGGGHKEYEVIWEASAPFKNSHFPRARFKFWFKMVNRRCGTKEFDEGGKKIEKQGGTWEFESKYTYVNDIAYKIDNIPVIGHWNWTKQIYYDKIYADYVEKDLYDYFAMVGKLRAIPVKYFSLLK